MPRWDKAAHCSGGVSKWYTSLVHSRESSAGGSGSIEGVDGAEGPGVEFIIQLQLVHSPERVPSLDHIWRRLNPVHLSSYKQTNRQSVTHPERVSSLDHIWRRLNPVHLSSYKQTNRQTSYTSRTGLQPWSPLEEAQSSASQLLYTIKQTPMEEHFNMFMLYQKFRNWLRIVYSVSLKQTKGNNVNCYSDTWC